MEEKRTLLTVIKENKGKIIRRALLVVGAALGLTLVSKAIKHQEEDESIVVNPSNAVNATFSEEDSEEQ